MAKDKSKKTQETVSCEIKEQFGYLNEGKTKVFALVSWGGREAKFDIRKCFKKEDNLALSSGISLTEEELDCVVEMYQNYKKSAVDFEDIFRSASSITEKRHQGFVTEDGFVKLTKKARTTKI